MPRYVADLDKMTALIEAAEAVGKRIDERLDLVDRDVAALGAHFKGATATAHQAKHEAWMKGAREMHSALAELKANVQRAHDAYQGNVEHNMRMWP